MNSERDEQLEAGYRRASEADAGRPAATTRVAILAEAAAGAAARRRATPAANESRYWLRAVAGLAVVGVGVLLWRQTDHRLPGEPGVVVVETLQQEDAAPAQVPEPGPAPAAPPAAVAVSGVEAAREQRAEQPVADEPPVTESQQVAAAPQLPAQPADALATARSADLGVPAQEAQRQRAAAPVTDELAERAVSATAQFAAGAATEADGLLRQHFPAQYQSDSAHRLWLVRDAAGEVLDSGELMPGQSLADLAPQLERSLAGRSPGAWRTEPVTNANGQPIELSISEIP